METLNIFRSWKSNCWQGERDVLDALDVYTHQELSEIASHGYNGIWLRGELHKLTPSKIFPEFGQEHKEYLKTLRSLVKRAAKHRIAVYLYFTEPVALPAKDNFWKNNKDLMGEKHYWPYEPKGYYYALCTSTQKVRDYLEDSFYLLFKKVKGLAGVIAITASETIGPCYSHIDICGRYNGKIHGVWKSVNQMRCPRCKPRPAAEVVVEVLNTMYAGINRADSQAKLIAWNWSWDQFYPDPQKEIISGLDRNIIVMSDFERGGRKKILGKDRDIDEYSVSYAGPSEKFKKARNLTKKTGHRFMAKLQIGTTHELATVPNLPLIGNLYKKAKYIKSNPVYGVMATWNFGNMRTLNTYAFGQALRKKKLTETIFYNDIVRGYLKVSPPELAKLKKAWELFGQAMDNYPFSVPFLYESVINYAPGYWLKPRKIKSTPLGRSWVLGKRGDDLSAGVKGYGLREVINGLENVCRKWDKGTEIYKTIFQEKTRHISRSVRFLSCQRYIVGPTENSLAGKTARLTNKRGLFQAREATQRREEYSCALAIGHMFRSALHIYKLYALCRRWKGSKCFSGYADLCRKELLNCQSLLPILTEDKRIGYHAECQGYMFNGRSVRDKMDMLITRREERNLISLRGVNDSG